MSFGSRPVSGRYLESKAFAGDSLYLWAYGDAEGKCPAEDGTVPRGGAY
jgi:hypothetical protein